MLPAYNAAQTVAQTVREIPGDLVDEIILVDDASQDDTVEVAESLGIRHVIRHDRNRGYGANQKTCYRKALALDADIVIMLHPDYQYTPMLLPAMASLVASGLFPVVLGSRILGGGAISGGMPVYKYLANRALTLFQNLCTGAKLSEYHTGYRAFSAEVLQALNLDGNSDDFIFDNQMLAQIIHRGYPIGEITCPTRYFEEASSINLARSVVYGLGVVGVSLQHLGSRLGLIRPTLFQ
ncbi:glycosyltransferase family 2 protein [Wenzhouxiangella sp. AB-CW3]|uniref:glycosyltransferase family 2 protein n=1 Tax=Wenzhouxiangella sp. AB-CW3 TaxID=2771012 RepID=UPI0021E09EC5|nr:glycosyltransferase family 2 protein [Wenzhouxiangella sp. AB-CW3]